MKKLLILGGSAFQIPVIERARRLGIYCITVDYLPHNLAHRYSDEYHNVSTVDKDGVLELARRLKIDGILAFATDIAAPTAAYVGQKMGLHYDPPDSVDILCTKSKLRNFLSDNGFNVPRYIVSNSLDAALSSLGNLDLPAIMKPSDSSGSKGVFVVRSRQDIVDNFDEAMHWSVLKQIVIEEYIDLGAGYSQLGGDFLFYGGKIRFPGFLTEYFSSKVRDSCTPIGSSFPCVSDGLDLVKADLTKLVNMLGMNGGVYNFDARIRDGKVYLLDFGPRAGGNYIHYLIQECTDIDLASYAVKVAMNGDGGGGGYDQELNSLDLDNVTTKQYCATHVLHSLVSGRFKRVVISPRFQRHVMRKFVSMKEGARVNAIRNAGDSIGVVMMKFDTHEEMISSMNEVENHITVQLHD